MQYISVPNSTVLNSNVINYKFLKGQASSAPQLTSLDILVPVETSGEELSELILKQALETPGVLGVPAPIVSNSRVNEKFVNYSLTIATINSDDNLKEEIKTKIGENLQLNRTGSQVKALENY
jgi:small-conductance mechanosensitive channel